MKRILYLIICCLLCVAGSSQTTNWQKISTPYQYRHLIGDSAIGIPYGAIPELRIKGDTTRPGFIFYNTSDSSLYLWTGHQWLKAIGGSGGGSNIGDSLANAYDSIRIIRDTLISHNERIIAAGSGGGGTWGSITGTISDQTDLQDSLNKKLNKTEANLQYVTTNGNKTTDTIIANAVRTKRLLPDTTNESDYSFIIVPDLQYMTQTYRAQGRSIFEWIRDNKTTENIQAVISTGDITNGQNQYEFDTLDNWFGMLDAQNIRYFTVPGNHDYDNQNTMFATGRDLTKYNTWASRYTSKPYYVSAMGSNYANSFYKFDVGTEKFAVISMEHLPPDSVLNWAKNISDSLYDADPLRKIILHTHAYIRYQGQRAVDSDPSSVNAYPAGPGGVGADNSGEEIWQKLVKPSHNIRWVFSGHFILNGQTPLSGSTHRLTDVNDYGNIVEQIYINYQQDDQGGGGFFMKMNFKPAEGKINVSVYSAYSDSLDANVTPYTISYPSIEVESSMGIKDKLVIGNQLRVGKEARFSFLTKGRIPFVTYDGRLMDSYKLRYSDDSARLLINDPTDNGSTTVQVNGSGKFSGELTGYPLVSSTIGRPTGFTGGNPATGYFVHGAGNYGISVTRAADDDGGASFSFYKTRNADPTVASAAVSGDNVGQLLFHNVSGNGTIRIGSRIEVVADQVGQNYVSTGMNFRNTDTSGAIQYPLILGSDMNNIMPGSLKIGSLLKAHSSSVLDLESTSKGFLMPRMTGTQMAAISTPATGLLIYNTDSSGVCYYNGSGWVKLGTGAGGGGGGGNTNSNVGSGFRLAKPNTNDIKTLSTDGTITLDSTTTDQIGLKINLASANTWTADQTVPAETYGSSWNGSNEVPTKNDVYDKIEAINATVTALDNFYYKNPIGADSAVFTRTGDDSSVYFKLRQVRAANATIDVTDSDVGDSIRRSSIKVNVANLGGSGTPSASTWLAGDSTWKTPTKSTVGLGNVDNTSDATKNSATATLTNKRWTPRVGSTTSSATPTINTDNYDIYKLTAQAADITSFTTNLSGTPNDGDILEIQITGTAPRNITWGPSFVSSTVTLPTATSGTTTLSVVFQYFTTSSYGNNKWVCVNSF